MVGRGWRGLLIDSSSYPRHLASYRPHSGTGYRVPSYPTPTDTQPHPKTPNRSKRSSHGGGAARPAERLPARGGQSWHLRRLHARRLPVPRAPGQHRGAGTRHWSRLCWIDPKFFIQIISITHDTQPNTGLPADQGRPRGLARDQRGRGHRAAAAREAGAPLPLRPRHCHRHRVRSRIAATLASTPTEAKQFTEHARSLNHQSLVPTYPSTDRSPSKGDGYDSACAAAGQLGLMSLYETLFSTRQVATSQARVN